MEKIETPDIEARVSIETLNNHDNTRKVWTLNFFLPECGTERENLFSNLEAFMARKEPDLSRSLTFEPGKKILLINSICYHPIDQC